MRMNISLSSSFAKAAKGKRKVGWRRTVHSEQLTHTIIIIIMVVVYTVMKSEIIL